MSTPYTPGPWNVTQASWDDETGDVRYTLGGVKIAKVADARLIAAAPELLEALELYALSYADEELVQLAECTDGMGEISPVTAKREVIRRAAIAKAKGEAK